MRQLLAAILLGASSAAAAGSCDYRDLVDGRWEGTGRIAVNQVIGGVVSHDEQLLRCRIRFELVGARSNRTLEFHKSSRCWAVSAWVVAETADPIQSRDKTVRISGLTKEQNRGRCSFRASDLWTFVWQDIGRWYVQPHAIIASPSGEPDTLRIMGIAGQFTTVRNGVLDSAIMHVEMTLGDVR